MRSVLSTFSTGDKIESRILHELQDLFENMLTFCPFRAINYLPKEREGEVVELPITQKYMLTIAEAAEYFGFGIKWMRRFCENHPEIAIRHGASWRVVRLLMEEYIKTAPINENRERLL